jgi:DNA-directed RNA polymerase specialized sigma24 family protein
VRVPDPVVARDEALTPEDEVLLADSVGLALSVVDTLAPAERVAFVLHDLFGVAFAEIAPMVGRSPAAARQLASRARRRVQARPTAPDVGLPAQQQVVDAFFAAAHDGNPQCPGCRA